MLQYQTISETTDYRRWKMDYEQNTKTTNEESRSIVHYGKAIIDTKKLNAECQGISANCSEI